jgi:hypothetical protein
MNIEEVQKTIDKLIFFQKEEVIVLDKINNSIYNSLNFYNTGNKILINDNIFYLKNLFSSIENLHNSDVYQLQNYLNNYINTSGYSNKYFQVGEVNGK